MLKKYSDCFYCGGVVKEKLTPREIRWKGKLFIFENVPLGVCTQCGEKVIKPEVAKDIDQLLQEEKNQQKLSRFLYINMKQMLFNNHTSMAVNGLAESTS